MSYFARCVLLRHWLDVSTQPLSKELRMKPSTLKALILLIVLVVAAALLAGWTWDDGGAMVAASAQQIG
jgi:hypothetical protein